MAVPLRRTRTAVPRVRPPLPWEEPTRSIGRRANMATTRRVGRIAGLAVAFGGALLIGAGFLSWAAAVQGGTTTTVGGWSLDAVRVGAALGAVLVVVGVAVAMVMNPV